MNNIEKITERILADAQAQADELLAQAKQEAAQIEARCQAQAQAEYDRILRQGETDAAAQLQRLDSADEAQGRRAILTEKQDQLEQTFSPVCPTVKVETVEQAVAAAVQQAQRGDVVLFSPGTSSFDQFTG